MYSLERFKEKFLEVNFDNYLLEQNSKYINSNEYYLQFKKDYLDKTRDNFNKFKNLLETYNYYKNIYKVDEQNFDYSFTYINQSKKIDINKELKNLILEQNKILNSFMDHIKFLNTNN